MMPGRGRKGRKRGGVGRNPQRGNGGGRGGQRLLRNSGINVTPNVLQTQVRYVVNYSATDGASLGPNTRVFQFRGNSIFDPDANATFEPFPIGVPAWNGLYARYQVHSSRITVRAVANGVIAQNACTMIGWAHQYTQALPSGAVVAEDFVGQPNAGPLIAFGPVSGASVGKFSMSRRTAFMLSRTDSNIFCGVDTSGVIASSDPLVLWWWNVVISNHGTSPLLDPAVTLTFELVYTVNLFEQQLYPVQNTPGSGRARRMARNDDRIVIEEIDEKEDDASAKTPNSWVGFSENHRPRSPPRLEEFER